VRAKTAPSMAKTRQNTTSNIKQQIHRAKFSILQPITTPKTWSSTKRKPWIHWIARKANKTNSTASWMSLTELCNLLKGMVTTEKLSTKELINFLTMNNELLSALGKWIELLQFFTININWTFKFIGYPIWITNITSIANYYCLYIQFIKKSDLFNFS